MSGHEIASMETVKTQRNQQGNISKKWSVCIPSSSSCHALLSVNSSDHNSMCDVVVGVWVGVCGWTGRYFRGNHPRFKQHPFYRSWNIINVLLPPPFFSPSPPTEIIQERKTEKKRQTHKQVLRAGERTISKTVTVCRAAGTYEPPTNLPDLCM